MIMFWNRKEVYMGFSSVKFYEVRQMLEAGGIKYSYNWVSNESSIGFNSRRSVTGSLGENLDYAITYYVYVHKKDYGLACGALRKG